MNGHVTKVECAKRREGEGEKRRKGEGMIWIITRKEFLQKLLDLRVTVSFAIVVALTVVSCFVAGEQYETEKVSSSAAIAKAQSDLREVKVYSEYNPQVIFPAGPLSVFSAGAGIPMPVVLKIQLDHVPEYQPVTASSNPLMGIFDSFDISKIVQVLFSLLVILLTYDSFSGEKEDGTLKLALSNSVSRLQLLAGKFLGTLVVVSFMVVISFAISLLFLQTVTGIHFSGADYARVLLAVIDSVLYLSVFVALGILVSIKFGSSSASLTTLLFIWLFVAILQPNLNRYLASEYTAIPRMADIQPTLNEVVNADSKDLDNLSRESGIIMRDQPKKAFVQRSGSLGNTQVYFVVPDAQYDQLKYLIEQTKLYRKCAVGFADDQWRLYRTLYLDKLDRQLHFERFLELFAPASSFTHTISILCGTGIDNLDEFMSRAREYRREYIRYLDSKGVFSNNARLFFSRLTSEDINPNAAAIRFARYEKDPESIPRLNNMPPLNLADAPVFTDLQFNPINDLGRAGVAAIPLIVFFLALVVWAGAEMRKYRV